MDQSNVTHNTSGNAGQPPGDCAGPIDLAKTRESLVRLIDAQALNMVTAIIGGVKDGHYAAVKYLFEVAGLYPSVPGKEDKDPDSLAAILLRRLDILDAESPKETESHREVTKDSACSTSCGS